MADSNFKLFSFHFACSGKNCATKRNEKGTAKPVPKQSKDDDDDGTKNDDKSLLPHHRPSPTRQNTEPTATIARQGEDYLLVIGDGQQE